MELTDPASIRNAVEAANQRFGEIDVLVNNAGHGYRAAVEEGEPESVAEVFQTNLFGPVELIQQILPQMRRRRNGAIVNLSSIAAVGSGVGSGYYAATKAALERISVALYQEVSPLGIKVMVVEPGAFRIRFFDDSLKGTQIRIDQKNSGKGWKQRMWTPCAPSVTLPAILYTSAETAIWNRKWPPLPKRSFSLPKWC